MPRTPLRRTHELIEFARRLTATIEALGLSKAAFARGIGATPGQLHHWLIGGNYPTADVFIAIRRSYGISCDWLLDGHLVGLPHDVAEKIQSTLEIRRGARKKPLSRN